MVFWYFDDAGSFPQPQLWKLICGLLSHDDWGLQTRSWYMWSGLGLMGLIPCGATTGAITNSIMSAVEESIVVLYNCCDRNTLVYKPQPHHLCLKYTFLTLVPHVAFLYKTAFKVNTVCSLFYSSDLRFQKVYTFKLNYRVHHVTGSDTWKWCFI